MKKLSHARRTGSRALFWSLGTSLLLGGLSALPAAAVEPLWGDMPLTLGKGTFHPVWRTRFLDAGNRGSGRMRMWEQELMLEYAPTADLNLRLDLPYQNTLQQMGAGSTFVSGLGDVMLRGKQRVGGTRGMGMQSQHSLYYGVKLPTGDDGHHLRFPGGARQRLNPVDQTGTGNPGILLGYGWTHEELWDAVWAGATWRRDIGGGFRAGDNVEANATFARWLKRPDEAEELGIKLSAGADGRFHGADSLGRGGSAGNSFGYAGFHVTPVITRGNQILQMGVFVPVVRGGTHHRVDFPFELRLGIESYF